MARWIVFTLLATLAIPASNPAQAALGGHLPTASQDDLAHGGGCRKSSPPGQCCHMNRKTGSVHCH